MKTILYTLAFALTLAGTAPAATAELSQEAQLNAFFTAIVGEWMDPETTDEQGEVQSYTETESEHPGRAYEMWGEAWGPTEDGETIYGIYHASYLVNRDGLFESHFDGTIKRREVLELTATKLTFKTFPWLGNDVSISTLELTDPSTLKMSGQRFRQTENGLEPIEGTASTTTLVRRR